MVSLISTSEGLLPGTFVRRDNRFRVTVQLGGARVAAHLADPGRLKELLLPGRSLFLRRAEGAKRVTAYDVALVDHGGVLVSVDSRLPNRLVEEALQAGTLPEFAGYDRIQREVPRGNSRLDFRLDGARGSCLLEVKSATLVRDGVAIFPDAPTERGRRHVEELREAASDGERAAVLFVVQRGDAYAFSTNDETDPLFASTLRLARRQGVEVFAYSCLVSRQAVSIDRALEVELGREAWA